MTQLIIGGVELPEVGNDRYRCYKEERGKQVEMIVPRTVIEIRGQVVMIEYSADYIEDAVLKEALRVLRSGRSFEVQYLPDDSDDTSVATFICKRLTPPSYLGSENGVPVWHNLSFALQSEYPIDEEE